MSLLSYRIYAHFFAVTAETFEFNSSVDFSKKSVISSAAHVFTWVDFRSALTVKDRSACYDGITAAAHFAAGKRNVTRFDFDAPLMLKDDLIQGVFNLNIVKLMRVKKTKAKSGPRTVS